MLRLAGYSCVGLTVPTGIMRDRITLLKSSFQEAGIEVALRIDLASRSRMELLRVLRRYRNSYDLIAVKCLNSHVATVACRDRRVDLVLFDPNNRNLRFAHPYANLLRGCLEFNLISSLLDETKREVFTAMRKQAAIAQEHDLEMVLSSGSNRPEMVRSPSQIAALASVMGLSQKQCFAGVSSTPLGLIERNSMRRSPQFIEEGVRLVLTKAG